MPGDAPGSDIGTVYYVRSDAAFNIARTSGLWEVLRRRIAGRNPYLKPLRKPYVDMTNASARGGEFV